MSPKRGVVQPGPFFVFSRAPRWGGGHLIVWLSRIEHGATALDLQLPIVEAEPPERVSVGGSSQINGVFESFEHLAVNVISVTLQFLESEWPAVEAVLTQCRRAPGTPFIFWFDRSDVATRYSVRLRSPLIPDPLRAKRGKPFGLLTLEVQLQTTSPNVQFALNFSGL